MNIKLATTCLLAAVILGSSAQAAGTAPMAVKQFSNQDRPYLVYALPRASDQLDSYAVGLSDLGNGKLRVSYSVFGTHDKMDCVGAKSIVIEEEIAPGVWDTYKSYSDLYNYSDISRLGSFEVSVRRGSTYRAVLTAYARDSAGNDTGEVTSRSVIAK